MSKFFFLISEIIIIFVSFARRDWSDHIYVI